MTARGLIIAAPASGCGKTTVTLALLRHLSASGLSVGSFKVGPDFIDTAFHAAATGRPCRNLDPWSMRPATLSATLNAVARDTDLVIGEGVMGLFDGADGEMGSTADLAARLGLPVVLVVDVGAQAASAGALVRGFVSHRTDVQVSAVIFNRVGGALHVETLRDACRPLGVPVLGMIPWVDDLTLPERHLGLVQAAETKGLDAFLVSAAEIVGRHVDIAELARLAAPIPPAPIPPAEPTDAPPIAPLGQRIAVARDAAFAFVYDHVLAGWRNAGCQILPFSPLAGEGVPAGADAVYLPGGYPELHAGPIAGNRLFIDGLHAAATRKAPVYGECGGYMVLGEALIDADGVRHPMAGLLPVVTSFADRQMHIGYRTLELASDTALGARGIIFRGHEFHFSSVTSEEASEPLFVARDVQGGNEATMGCVRGSVMGSFAHLIDRA